MTPYEWTALGGVLVVVLGFAYWIKRKLWMPKAEADAIRAKAAADEANRPPF